VVVGEFLGYDKVLAHTLAIWINRSLGRPDLQFEGLITVG
jgi:hypothetical protein